MRPNTGIKLGWVFMVLALLIGMGTATFDAHAYTITFQTPDPQRKCPRPHPDATMSISMWNVNGWPLWHKFCWYKEKK